MLIIGERLLIAATVDPVETGQEFRKVPLHMSLQQPFSFPDTQKKFLFGAMENFFDGKVIFQDAVGGKKVMYGPDHDVPAREMLRVQGGPWFGLRALIKSMGKFPKDNQFVDVFSPHVSDMLYQAAKRGQQIAFPTVALFATNEGDPIKRVLASYELGSKEPRG